ncbi:hypothetical protein LK542_00845 [Massilia sp. IC2-477]|uniref:hypothetical protein n=1 Tax=Massilia sp. IC2-477 TaxID=2887198 RepID=UPI001D127CCB|nr:hypothetical protein [Massilia sp. IC2-477]MCC2954157.1 hypothetical protein [Massilia sp. IC2-477]
MMMKKSVIACLLALPLAVSTAYAQDGAGFPAVKVSGFGTGALTYADSDKAEFARPNQASGSSKDYRTGIDSNLGLQADLPVNSWLSFTAQGLVRRDAEDSYGAELSWAFAKAKLADNLSLRVGRVGLPVFMISDYRNVGYANTMLRPPAEVYSQVPFNSVDGADITWQHGFGDTTVTSQLAYGKVKAPLTGGIHARGKKLAALNISAEHGPFTVRAGHATGEITIADSTSLNTLVGGLRAAGTGYRFPQLNTLAGEIEPKEKRATFSSLGLSMDWNNVVVQTEFAKRKTKAYINDTSAWYVMGGYRIGKFLPYVTHANLKIDSAIVNTVPATCPPGYPAACTPTLQQLGAGVRRLPNSGVGQGEQSTNSIGVRWDFASSVALKAQIDRVKPKNGTGLFVAAQPGFNDTVTVGAIALDFVF